MDVPELFSIPPPPSPTQQLEDVHAPFAFKFFLFILMTLIASIITFSKKKHWGKKNMLPSTLDMAPSPSKWNPRPSTLDPRQKDRLTTDKAQAFEPSRPTDFGV